MRLTSCVFLSYTVHCTVSLVGSRNCKPETKDRDVRIIYSGGSYEYEEFAAVIASFASGGVADDVSACGQVSQTEQHNKHAGTQTAPLISSSSDLQSYSQVSLEVDSREVQSDDHLIVKAVAVSVSEGECLFVSNKTLGCSEWI